MRNTIPYALALLSATLTAGSPAANAGTYEKLFDFRGHVGGSQPQAGLIQIGKTLYGTATSSGGTVFAFRPGTGAVQVRYRFDGGEPQAPVINAGGTLYGATVAGGLGQYGTVYAVHPKTGKGHILYAFRGDADGYFPEAGLVYENGMLYGTTIGGGADHAGTLFAVNIATGAKQIVHSFQGGADGGNPHSALLKLNGVMYGTTTNGGPSQAGTVYRFNPVTGAEKVVYAFTGGSDGGEPAAGLISIGGLLYGTTSRAGSTACLGGCGVAFSIDPATGTETVLYSFQGGTDGQNPSGDLLKVGDLLYGTTGGGGAACTNVYGCGTVFSLDPKTGIETVLYAFQDGADGATPNGALVDVGGTLYGTTYAGGANRGYRYPCNFGCGTIFAYTP